MKLLNHKLEEDMDMEIKQLKQKLENGNKTFRKLDKSKKTHESYSKIETYE